MKVLLDICVGAGRRLNLEQGRLWVPWTGDLTHDPGDEDILVRLIANSGYSSRSVGTLANWQFGAACRILASCVWSTLPATARRGVSSDDNSIRGRVKRGLLLRWRLAACASDYPKVIGS